jgi:hypothetical protein
MKSEQTQSKYSGFKIRSIFNVNETTGVSAFRIYLLRFFYFLAIPFLGIQVWTELFTHAGPWQPLPAVAFSFWGAFSALALLGIRYPLKMIPLLLLQFSYKVIWLIIVAYPLWTAGQLTGSPAQALAKANAMGFVMDALIIPWPYVLKNFILKSKGDM